LQGDVEEHVWAIRKAAEALRIPVEIVRVKRERDLEGLSAIFLPGGESTTFAALVKPMANRLKAELEGGLPAFGTCAGAILLAKEVRDAVVGPTGQLVLGILDIAVVRNAFGRQKHSFEREVEVEGVGKVKGIFIRAPAIVEARGAAKPIAYVDSPMGRVIAAVRQDPHLATIFHPELSDPKLHALFLAQARR